MSTTTESAPAAPPPDAKPGKATSANLALYLIDTPIVLLVLFVGVLGFIGSFDGMNRAMMPYFGGLAWIVPTGIDASILAFSAADLRLILRGLPVAGLRYAVWGLSAVTVVLNFFGAGVIKPGTAAATAQAATAAENDLFQQILGQVAHAMMPILWIIAIEVGRKAVAKAYDLEHDTYMEPIPWDMWLRPIMTARMWIRRRTTRIKRVEELVGREQARMLAIMRLRHQARTQGLWLARWRWRRVATADELWAIRTYNLNPTGAMRRTAEVVSRGILSADLVAATAVTASAGPPAPALEPAPAAVPVPAPAVNVTPPPVKAPAKTPTPAPAAPVNGHAVAAVHTPAAPPPGRPDGVGERTWANLFASPEGQLAWEAYVAHRTETGETPEVRHLRERVTLTKDRTTVSKWMPMFHARWDAEHAVHDQADGGVHAPAGDTVNPHADTGVHTVHTVVPDTVEDLVGDVHAAGVNGDRATVNAGA
ncbi:DUF2637 domain-containing protein [Planobispora siamensis]|uniref:DUF2637 domain-containing protein n=1 Tax=Planobispora siamensis TaxID=936338 RepID=A0A8J3SLX9_9ACTN|nr:DUF2637 domain-containing protein [Planobispora siamensis]GIH95277.1 hypothetical protein Psi01_59070 [Planobispora siamensis]